MSSRHNNPAAGHDHQAGRLLDRGWRYDAEVWLFDTFAMRGQLGQLRGKVLDTAALGAGQRVLDVGCGTGTLAIQVAKRVGPEGQVSGIDPAPRQIARARAKARRAGHDIDFRQAPIQELPYDDGSFDVVTSTLMMHHLPAEVATRGLAEINRVLEPQGRLVVADFDTAEDTAEDIAEDAAEETAEDAAEDTADGADQGHGHSGNAGDQAAGATLAEMIAAAGFTQIATDTISFTRQHRGWSGVTLTSAIKP